MLADPVSTSERTTRRPTSRTRPIPGSRSRSTPRCSRLAPAPTVRPQLPAARSGRRPGRQPGSSQPRQAGTHHRAEGLPALRAGHRSAVVLRKTRKANPRAARHPDFNDAPTKDTIPTSETTDRHVAPPLASQLLAEAHGKFDAMSPAAYALVSSKQGTFEDPSDPDAKVVVHPGTARAAVPPDPLSRGATFLGLPIHQSTCSPVSRARR